MTQKKKPILMKMIETAKIMTIKVVPKNSNSSNVAIVDLE